MSRNKMIKVPINREFFQKALKRKNLSINKITNEENNLIGGISRRTITRALHDGLINPEFLHKIAEVLDVSPHWLTGKDLMLFPGLINNSEYCKIENHPYNKIYQQQKGINYTQYFKSLLVLQGVSLEQFQSLSEEQQHGFEMELDLVIKMVIIKHFSPCATDGDLFLSNKDLYQKSCEVLSGKVYDELFDLLEA